MAFDIWILYTLFVLSQWSTMIGSDNYLLQVSKHHRQSHHISVALLSWYMYSLSGPHKYTTSIFNCLPASNVKRKLIELATMPSEIQRINTTEIPSINARVDTVTSRINITGRRLLACHSQVCHICSEFAGKKYWNNVHALPSQPAEFLQWSGHAASPPKPAYGRCRVSTG